MLRDVASNLQIDFDLLNRAHKVGGLRTRRDTIHAALLEYVKNREQRTIAEHFGTIDFSTDFDHKKIRASR